MCVDLGLSQILPMMDEETGAEPRVVSASIVDPYLMIIRDDNTVFIAKIGSSDELEEVDKPSGLLTSTKWQAGCLYADSQGTFQPMQSNTSQASEKTMMFLLSTTGALHVRLVTVKLRRWSMLTFAGVRSRRSIQPRLCSGGASVHATIPVCKLYWSPSGREGGADRNFGC